MASRCGGSNIKIGDKYSIRHTDRVHWFIEIQSKKKNGERCYFTIGLGLLERSEAQELYKDIPGPKQYKGFAVIFSPDRVELECHRRLFKDANEEAPEFGQFGYVDYRCRNIKYFKNLPKKELEKRTSFNKKKMYFRGSAVKSFRNILNPKARYYSGKINVEQLKVIKHFVANKKYKNYSGLKYKRIVLPSPYFILAQYDPDILAFLENKGVLKKKWWNCRKFVNLFHRQPEVLSAFLKDVGVKRRSSVRKSVYKRRYKKKVKNY